MFSFFIGDYAANVRPYSRCFVNLTDTVFAEEDVPLIQRPEK